jgi:hypothetical protein
VAYLFINIATSTQIETYKANYKENYVDLLNGLTCKIFTSDTNSYPYWPITLKLLEHQLPERLHSESKLLASTVYGHVFFFHLWGKYMIVRTATFKKDYAKVRSF